MVVPVSTYREVVRVRFSMVLDKENVLTFFQADAQYKALESKQTLTRKFRGSAPRTGQT